MPKQTELDVTIAYQTGALEGEISGAEIELITSILPSLVIEMMAIDETGKERYDSRAVRTGLNDPTSGE